MVLDPIPQPLPVHFFGSRPQPLTCLSDSRDPFKDTRRSSSMFSRPFSIVIHRSLFMFIHLSSLVIYRSLLRYTRLIVHVKWDWSSVVCQTLLIHSQIRAGLISWIHVSLPHYFRCKQKRLCNQGNQGRCQRKETYSRKVTRRGGGLGSSTIFKKINEPYAPS